MRHTGFAALALSSAILAVLAAAPAFVAAPAMAQDGEGALPENLAAIHEGQPMNAFRRFRGETQEAMFAFYTDVVGLEAASAFTELRVYTFKGGQFKLNPRDGGEYIDGGVEAATGVRLFSFFYPDEATIAARFEAVGLPAPDFTPVPGSTRSIARTADPDGHAVEFVAAPDEPEAWALMEIGLTVSDIDVARDFYENFAGLTPIAPEPDPISGVTKFRYQQDEAIVSLRSFGADLPADTGGGGIQHVVRDTEVVDRLARARGVQIDQPLSTLQGYALRTIWLSDPDGITNYFAQVGAPAQAAAE
jgi:predicted enzyme related to lactoylglutathione lyase